MEATTSLEYRSALLVMLASIITSPLLSVAHCGKWLQWLAGWAPAGVAGCGKVGYCALGARLDSTRMHLVGLKM
ncbi:hypothetical protein HPP92_006029 [Vanilla planifolia]|uniref:Uncharacterized protein n=1 Tax=Vanilla planifolia TaxID=51239 RepID=A0A835RPT4_VANPL|nr:hypothetical protein HPP92_006029 [Vanilla planifolia]